MQIVSYGGGTQPPPSLSFRAQRSGVEKSPAEQFPAAMNPLCSTPNRKPFANSFLSR